MPVFRLTEGQGLAPEAYGAIWNAMAEGVVVQSRSTEIVGWNRAAEEILGLTGEQIAGRTSIDPSWRAIHPDGSDFPGEDHPSMVLIRTGRPQRNVLMGVDLPAGGRRWLRINAEPVGRDADGLPHQIVCTFSDVTDEQMAKLELARSRETAERANAAKSRFLANMSHEIRTPLNSVLGMAQALEATDLPKQAQRMVEVIRQAGDGLMAILDDALDITRIEAGTIVIDQHPFLLAELRDRVLGLHAARAAELGLVLEVDATDLPGVVRRGDLHRVLQILHNLVFNAFKNTRAGRVSVSMAPDPRMPEIVEFRVTDTGRGMSSSEGAGAFEPFRQGSSNDSGGLGGVGLGLAISQDIAAAMFGEISFLSCPGEGTVFTVRLPLTISADGPKAARSRRSGRDRLDGVRILIVEDDPMNRLVMDTLLEPLGAQIAFAHDGVEAVRIFDPHRFDVVLMDISMPHMTGDLAMKTIRRELDPEAQVPIVALTAQVLSHQVEALLQAGFDAHTPKPLILEDLLATLERVMRERRPLPLTPA